MTHGEQLEALLGTVGGYEVFITMLIIIVILFALTGIKHDLQR